MSDYVVVWKDRDTEERRMRRLWSTESAEGFILGLRAARAGGGIKLFERSPDGRRVPLPLPGPRVEMKTAHDVDDAPPVVAPKDAQAATAKPKAPEPSPRGAAALLWGAGKRLAATP